MVLRMAAALCAALCLPLDAIGQTVTREPLTLHAALDLASRQAPAVRAALARAEAEAAAAEAARAWRNPTVDVSIENLGPQDLDHDAFVWFTQPLDIGTRRSTRIAAATASRDLLARDADVRRRIVDMAIIDAYFAAVRARQLLTLLDAHLRATSEVVQLLRRRVSEGVSPEGDLRKLEAEAARTRIAQVRAEVELRQHAIALGVLIGEVDPTLGERLEVPALLPVPPAGPAVVAAALERRADVRIAVARADERRAAAAAERALGGTAIAATGGYKRTSGFNTATAGISIDLPIGQRNVPARLRVEGDATAAVLELEQVRASARADADQALHSARVLTEEATRATADLVEPASIARQAARAAMREGTGDAHALVDADRVYLDTQREAMSLQLDAIAAVIRARVALGEDPLP
jgi:cobalt-zinc-cadmium efflux system outer membrane protein